MSGKQNLNKYSVRPKYIRYLLGYLALFLGSLLAKIKLQGSEYIPRNKPFIVVCNHFSRLDPPFVIYAIKKPINFLMASDQEVETEIMWAPWLYGFIPTNRENIAPSTIKQSISAIKKGEVVGVFPEGTASEQKIRPAKNGAAYLAMTTGAPILPMSIIGLDDVWSNWFKGVRPRIKIKIGHSFVPKSLPIKHEERNQAIKHMGKEIMCRIAALLPSEFHGVHTDDPRIKEINQNNFDG